MAVSTSVKPHYTRWAWALFIVSVLIGLWGVYDYTIKLPRQQAQYDRFIEVQHRLAALIELRDAREAAGGGLTSDEIAEYEALEQEMAELAPGGENPVPPNKFDWVFQWVCILCLPMAPYFLWQLRRAKRKGYRLDDDGTLHLPQPHGTWKPEEIKDIDMSRWMKKSVATVVHADGTRVKLDDYIYQDTDKIVGAIAHRLYPERWDEDAKPVKNGAAGESGEDTDDARGSTGAGDPPDSPRET